MDNGALPSNRCFGQANVSTLLSPALPEEMPQKQQQIELLPKINASQVWPNQTYLVVATCPLPADVSNALSLRTSPTGQREKWAPDGKQHLRRSLHHR